MNSNWDKLKANSNKVKHGVSFEIAERVFSDPFRIEYHDNRENYGEDRWVTIGSVVHLVLCVAYTVRDGDTIRIISARRANEKERKQYSQSHL